MAELAFYFRGCHRRKGQYNTHQHAGGHPKVGGSDTVPLTLVRSASTDLSPPAPAIRGSEISSLGLAAVDARPKVETTSRSRIAVEEFWSTGVVDGNAIGVAAVDAQSEVETTSRREVEEFWSTGVVDGNAIAAGLVTPSSTRAGAPRNFAPAGADADVASDDRVNVFLR